MHANGQQDLFVLNDASPIASDTLVTQRQLAFIFKLSSSAISRWPLQPVRRFGREVFYSMAEAVAHRFAADGRPDLTAERARLAAAQADKAQLDNACRALRLIDVRIAMDAFAAQIANAKNRFIGMGAKMASEICGAVDADAGRAAEVEDLIEREVREILEELAADVAARDIEREVAGRG